MVASEIRAFGFSRSVLMTSVLPVSTSASETGSLTARRMATAS